MSFNKKIKSVIVLLFCVYLASCTTIENQYSVSRITNFQNEANEDTFAVGYGSDKIIPSRIEELIVSNVGAESYFIAPLHRFESDYVKYHNPYKQLPMASLTKIMTALIVLKNVDEDRIVGIVLLRLCDLYSKVGGNVLLRLHAHCGCHQKRHK